MSLVPIGTCSKFPHRLCGRRARVVLAGMPYHGEIGVIESITGRFATAHDGILECVHIDVESAVTLSFDNEAIFMTERTHVSGYLALGLELRPVRYKVWTIDPDGEPSTLLVLAGSDDPPLLRCGDYDTDIDFGDDVGRLVTFAWEHADLVADQHPVLVKNFDTNQWWRASIVNGDLTLEETTR